MAKAATKAEKIRRRRGRPRIEGAAREPNGRVSRSGIDHGPADVVALEARRRHLGLTREQAKDQKAGTYIGYLNLLGKRDGLSNDQYEAACQFQSLYRAYQRAIQSPGRLLDGDGGMASAEITEAYEEWAKRTKTAYDECRSAIQEAQNEQRQSNLWAALDLCVIQGHHMPHMLGDLRILCNALARHFRI